MLIGKSLKKKLKRKEIEEKKLIQEGNRRKKLKRDGSRIEKTVSKKLKIKWLVFEWWLLVVAM